MHMRMVMVAGRRHLVGTVRRHTVVVMVISVFVAMVTEMGGMVLRVFQHVANAHDRRISGVQREDDGEKKGETGAHGGLDYTTTVMKGVAHIANMRRFFNADLRA